MIYLKGQATTLLKLKLVLSKTTFNYHVFAILWTQWLRDSSENTSSKLPIIVSKIVTFETKGTNEGTDEDVIWQQQQQQ